MPAVELGVALGSKNSRSDSERQPALSDEKRDRVAGVDRQHRLEVAREVAVSVRRSSGSSWTHQKASSLRTASTTRATDGMYASSIFQYGYGTS